MGAHMARFFSEAIFDEAERKFEGLPYDWTLDVDI
jgi:hypothetical protein